MAEAISVRIALEGGKLVEEQLAAIGKEGVKAFDDIDKAASKVGGFNKLDPDQITAKLKKFGITGVAEIARVQEAVGKAAGFERIAERVAVAERAFGRL